MHNALVVFRKSRLAYLSSIKSCHCSFMMATSFGAPVDIHASGQQTSKRVLRQFAPLNPGRNAHFGSNSDVTRTQHGEEGQQMLTKLEGIVFDVDGTLW